MPGRGVLGEVEMADRWALRAGTGPWDESVHAPHPAAGVGRGEDGGWGPATGSWNITTRTSDGFLVPQQDYSSFAFFPPNVFKNLKTIPSSRGRMEIGGRSWFTTPVGPQSIWPSPNLLRAKSYIKISVKWDWKGASLTW